MANEAISLPDTQPTHCANCGTRLQGKWCHVCGQSTKHMLRHLPDLIEDASELLFHLNGRVFRTLPTLYLFPGRLTREYLAGRRVRYVTPFRLMFVLCLISFFFLHISLRIGEGAGVQRKQTSTFATARTPQAVFERLDTENARVGEQISAAVPGSNRTQVASAARDALDLAALQRLQALQPAAPLDADQAARVDASAQRLLRHAHTAFELQRRLGLALSVLPPTALQQREQLQNTAGARLAKLQAAATVKPATPASATVGAEAGLQAFFQRHLERFKANVGRISGSKADREHIINRIFSLLPQSMLVLVPLFALLLQLLYLFGHRLYMEHLIVALYSHAFMFLSLLLLMGLGGLAEVLPSWAATPIDWLSAAAWIWIPVYLLLMQKRVYGQGWGITAVKYVIAGTAYVGMLAATVLAAVLVGMAG